MKPKLLILPAMSTQTRETNGTAKVYSSPLRHDMAILGIRPVVSSDMDQLSKSHEKPNYRTLIVGGGCFWCQDAVYRQTKGVVESESGYIGGHIDHPTYEQITTGQTGHAEAVKEIGRAHV